MLDVKNIYPITDFARNTRSHVKRLRATGKPEVLTMNGRAVVIVQDAQAYQRLLERADYVDTVRTMRRRLATFQKNRGGRPMRKAVEELARENGIPLKKK